MAQISVEITRLPGSVPGGNHTSSIRRPCASRAGEEARALHALSIVPFET
jgi:hypothetical protein